MRRTWADRDVAAELLSVSSEIGVMPSYRYLKSVGKGDLAQAISRRGGFIKWAGRLGISHVRSDSETGWDGEIAVSEILKRDGFRVSRCSDDNNPFDLLVNDVLKVDCKAASKKTYGHVTGWFYRTGKTPQADLMAFYQFDTKDIFFVPWFHCPTTNITLSVTGGQYAKFRNNFDLVRRMIQTRFEERVDPMFSMKHLRPHAEGIVAEGEGAGDLSEKA